MLRRLSDFIEYIESKSSIKLQQIPYKDFLNI